MRPHIPTIKMEAAAVVAAIKMGVELKAISPPPGAEWREGIDVGFHGSWPLFHWKVHLNVVLFEYLAYQF
jgi:hypothetical protein